MRTTAWLNVARAAARRAILVAAIALPVFLSATTYAGPAPAQTDATMRLSGHVLPALAHATRQPQSWTKWLTGSDATDAQSITLTIVLNRDDEAGFQQYLRDVYDPASPIFRKFLTPAQIAERFGPTQSAYDDTLAWLKSQGFELVEGSTNRMTLAVRGTRASAAKSFAVTIDDYAVGEHSFYANNTDPALPPGIAVHVQAIAGLSNLGVPHAPQPQRMIRLVFGTAVCSLWAVAAGEAFKAGAGAGSTYNYYAEFIKCFKNLEGKSPYDMLNGSDPPPPAWQDANGTGQTIGLVEFDSYNSSDIADYIALIGLPDAKINDVSPIHVNGGAGAPAASQDEVLLDIDTVLTLAPGAAIRVYDAPFAGGASFQALFNRMITDHVTIISNSWAYCEDQTTLADVTSIDSVLQTAAAAGISVFNGAGDTGSTCLDGAANTIGVPADSPHATAVGGTSLTQGPGHTYGSETWWNGSADTPPSGQGGFGVSRFFARPAWQNGFTGSAMRSIPDVASNADPAHGIVICNANEGGCPTGALNGGTSFSAPTWAAFTALLNQTQGSNLGALNPQIYPLAASGAFHDAASMGSDFAHVGLGSPRLGLLHQKLTAQTTGAVDAAVSTVFAYGYDNLATFPATADGLLLFDDGATSGYVVVTLADAMGNFAPGKTVTLTANAGAHATITPASAVTDISGKAVFKVTDLTAEPLVLTARDQTDGVALTQTAKFDFFVNPAASSSIVALTATAAADGVSTDSITVTLQDALGRPTPGKFVALAQTGHSVISAPSPSVTDASGKIVFIVTDTVQETVTYTATDVSDGDLPVPGSALVTFNAGGGDNCGGSNFGDPNISAAPGYAMTPYATGFLPRNVAAGGLYSQCRGANGLAFDAGGNLFVSDASNGNIFKFPPGGGVAGAGTLLTSTPLGPLLAGLTFGKDGKFYAAQIATTGNFLTGAVLEVNPANGALVRTVASSITCASFLTTDPASGDLFVDDSCGGGGSDNPSIWRIASPGSATPATTVYATTSGTNGGLAFAPGGTLYAIDYLGTGLSKIAGTAATTPGLRTQLNGVVSPALDIVALGTGTNGDAATLVAGTQAIAGGLPAGIKIYDATTTPISAKAMLVNNAFATVDLLGPDGCLYAGMVTTVYKITNADGSCPLKLNPALLTLSPSTVSPNPAQGTTQTFTTRLQNATVTAGTPVYFQVSGANSQARMVRADQYGVATFAFNGVHAGDDRVAASIAISGGTTLVSNVAKVAWANGSHVTSLSLNPSLLGGTAGQSIAVKAVLIDLSANPLVRLSGQSVTFTLGTQSCVGSTDANGVASCAIALPSTQIGQVTLRANFAGSSQFLASSDSSAFTILAAAAVITPTTTALTASPNPVTAGQALTLTASVAANAPTSTTGSAQALPAAATGNVTFTDNGATIGGAALDASGRATFVTSALAVGAHSLIASYAGDANNAASTSAALAITVLAAPSGIAVPAPALAAWALAALAIGLMLAAARKRRPQRRARVRP
ncbi:protease pro-enzyme activation domain-containing protein [Rudaea sp.]|uniref:protease pro-enzyme activation domain-containing protein n=1 Tax=Rudaea sp. TaxID=2136325 RepID=UPI003783F286